MKEEVDNCCQTCLKNLIEDDRCSNISWVFMKRIVTKFSNGAKLCYELETFDLVTVEIEYVEV